MINQFSKTFVEIVGKQYPVDGFTNITPKILSLVDRRLFEQRDNPIALICDRIRHFFQDRQVKNGSCRYDEFHYKSPVVTTEDNFDSLLIPKDHVSRKKADTYYVNSGHLLRSHSSAHQMDCLRRGSKAFISIADCYRRDEIDRTHYPVFHQCEIFRLYNHKEVYGGSAQIENIYDNSSQETSSKQGVYSQISSNFVEQELKCSIEVFVKDFFGDHDLKTRWVDAYFPFTHPSFELEILWGDKWMEVLGCGIVRDEILKNAGIQDHIGFAAGFGLERFGMLKYEIPDIRLFWSQDTGFLHQFKNKSPFDEVKFKSFSRCPQCINDLSFWLPQDASAESAYTSNDFYDLCRSVGGDLIEQVSLIDDFTHPKTRQRSHCYRIVYRAADRVLRKEEVNVIHEQIAEACKEQFLVKMR